MSDCAVFAKVKIELILLEIHIEFLHTADELVIVLLTLRTADDLSDTRNKAVHSRNSLSVRIELHVESLDFLRIICDEDRSLKDLLCQVALVLSLKVDAPLDRVVELLAGLQKNIDCFRVSHMAEFSARYALQAINETLVDELIEESHLFRSILKNIVDDILDHRFRDFHVIFKICKCHLRLNHPELRCMARGIGILGTECRSECVHVAE